MSNLKAAEDIREKIERNRHYNSSCFSTYNNYYYNEFCSKKNVLSKYRNLYNSFEPLKDNIQKKYNNIIFKENELKNNRKIYENELNNSS